MTMGKSQTRIGR